MSVLQEMTRLEVAPDSETYHLALKILIQAGEDPNKVGWVGGAWVEGGEARDVWACVPARWPVAYVAPCARVPGVCVSVACPRTTLCVCMCVCALHRVRTIVCACAGGEDIQGDATKLGVDAQAPDVHVRAHTHAHTHTQLLLHHMLTWCH
jgi:hypothetical protein